MDRVPWVGRLHFHFFTLFLGGLPLDFNFLQIVLCASCGVFTLFLSKISGFMPMIVARGFCYPTVPQHNHRDSSYVTWLVWESLCGGRSTTFASCLSRQQIRLRASVPFPNEPGSIHITCSCLLHHTYCLHLLYLAFNGCRYAKCFIEPGLDTVFKNCLLLPHRINLGFECLGLLHFGQPLCDSDHLCSTTGSVIGLLQLSCHSFYSLYGWVLMKGSQYPEQLTK